MNKKAIRIAGWALGLSMAVAGIGAAVNAGFIASNNEPMMVKAEEEICYTLDCTDDTQGTNGYATDSEITCDEISWYATANTKMNPWRVGGKNLTSVNRHIWSTEAVSANDISKVVITTGTATATVNSITLNVGDEAKSSSESTVSGSWVASSTITFNKPSGDNWSSKYFDFVFNVTAGGSNQYAQISKIEFYYESSISVTGVSLSETNKGLVVGDTFDLTATVTPNDATNDNVTWSSSNESVATVSDSGTVTAVAAGTADITVTTEDGEFTATCKVTVSSSAVSVTGVSLDKASITLIEELTEQLTATISPEGATNSNVTWTSSDTDVATVSDTGLVTAVAAGTATITVTTADGGYTATCTVTVNSKSVESIEIQTQPAKTLYAVGDTFSAAGLTFDASYDNGTTDEDLAYNVSGATYSKSGAFTLSEVGEQTITLTYGSKTDTFTVDVVNSVTATQWVESTTTDELTYSLIGVSGTSYSEWTGKASNSSAVYAGQSAGGNSSIQLRSTSPAGIITTSSGGNAKTVTLTWNSNSASGRTVDVYGKNTAYSAASELYSTSTQGTKLGSIVYGTSTVLNITGEYAYIGLRSNSGALYLDKVQIEWGEEEKVASQSVAGSVVKEVNDFISGNLKFNDISKDDGTSGTACLSGFGDIESAYGNLSKNAKLVIMTSNSDYATINEETISYPEVKARLEAWAEANGKTLDPDTGALTTNNGLSFFGFGKTESGAEAQIVIISLIGVAVAAGGVIYAMRKKKEN